MQTRILPARLLASALLLPLAACSPPAAPAGSSTSNTSASASTSSAASAFDKGFNAGSAAGAHARHDLDSDISKDIRNGIDQAKQQLLTQNIDINGTHIDVNGHDVVSSNGNLPKAQITPQGELLIAGKPVPATPAQQTLLQGYRQQIIGIAEAGMDIGASSADVGIAAAKQAILGAFDGKSNAQIEASIKPQTDKIQAAAMQLCKRLPDMLASQQKLAAAMPAFQPYATMTQKDVDDCAKGMHDRNGKKGFAVFSD